MNEFVKILRLFKELFVAHLLLERFEYEKNMSSRTNVSDIIVFIKYNKNLTLYTKLFLVAASLFALSSPMIKLNIYVL